MTLTRFGIREWGSGLIVAALLLIGTIFLIRHGWRFTGWTLSAVVVLLFLALAAFFRNPRRVPPEDPELLVAPADGVVRDIEVVEDFTLEPFTGRARRVGIFLSVLNVHVNRAPAEWSVVSKVYREGYYLDARNPDCARVNEAMTLAGTGRVADRTFPLAVRQISGAIARRIVCPVEPGRKLTRGQVYGMIKFGSRTELYVPEEGVEILVKVGDRVYGGRTAIARVCR